MPRLLTKQDLSALFGVSHKTIERWMKNEGLPHLKMKRLVRFEKEKVTKWMKVRFEVNI